MYWACETEVRENITIDWTVGHKCVCDNPSELFIVGKIEKKTKTIVEKSFESHWRTLHYSNSCGKNIASNWTEVVTSGAYFVRSPLSTVYQMSIIMRKFYATYRKSIAFIMRSALLWYFQNTLENCNGMVKQASLDVIDNEICSQNCYKYSQTYIHTY